MKAYCAGNTLRLLAEFYDFNEGLVDPDIIKVLIYNSKQEIIKEVVIGVANRVSLGKYFYDYQTENEHGMIKLYTYEFYGEIDGLITRERKPFQTEFYL